MYINYHYNCVPSTLVSTDLLDSYGIKYETLFMEHRNEYSLHFDVRDNVPKGKELLALLPQERLEGEDHIIIVKSKHYEKEDYAKADWFMISPGSSCPWLGSHDDLDSLSYERMCVFTWREKEYPRHIVQTKPIALSKEPSLKKKLTFYSGGYCGSAFLCDSDLVELLQNSGLNGFAFQNVLIGETKQHPSRKVRQLVATQELMESAIETNDPKATVQCDCCGRKLLAYRSSVHNLILKEKLDNAIDFWQTPPMFGCYLDYQVQQKPLRFATVEKVILGTSSMIISKRAYNFFESHKLTRRMVVIPLERP